MYDLEKPPLNELAHYGVKGMKWGKRKPRTEAELVERTERRKEIARKTGDVSLKVAKKTGQVSWTATKYTAKASLVVAKGTGKATWKITKGAVENPKAAAFVIGAAVITYQLATRGKLPIKSLSPPSKNTINAVDGLARNMSTDEMARLLSGIKR